MLRILNFSAPDHLDALGVHGEPETLLVATQAHIPPNETASSR